MRLRNHKETTVDYSQANSIPGTVQEDFAKGAAEKILSKRMSGLTAEYLLKWIGESHENNTWEREENLDCDDLLREFNEQPRSNDLRRIEDFPDKEPDRIINAAHTNTGELLFLMKWKGGEQADLILAEDANLLCPQLVIDFYETRLVFRPDPVLYLP